MQGIILIKWAETVIHVMKNASPRKKNVLNKMQNKRKQTPRRYKEQTKQFWRQKIRCFLLQDDISRQMPNKRDVVQCEGTTVAKKHLCCTKKEAFLKFLDKHPLNPYKYTTFRKSWPRFIKKMNLHDRRVCVCMKCFNFNEKLRSLSWVAVASCKLQPLTVHGINK